MLYIYLFTVAHFSEWGCYIDWIGAKRAGYGAGGAWSRGIKEAQNAILEGGKRSEKEKTRRKYTYILLDRHNHKELFIVLKVHAPREVPLIGCQTPPIGDAIKCQKISFLRVILPHMI